MSTPKVTIVYGNGGLLADIAAVDGIAGIVGTGTTPGLLGVPKVVYNLADAEDQGFTAVAEPDMHRHLTDFYTELGGNQELHIMTVPATMTMAEMLTVTEAAGAVKLLTAALGKVRLLGVFRNPDGAYDAGAEFFDEDVADALLTSLVFGQSQLAALRPCRMLIEGRINDASVSNTLVVKDTANGFSGVVAGSQLDDGSGAVGLALGRAVKYGAHIKLGKVANGPLHFTDAYIGDELLNDFAPLEALHGAGVITFMRHPQKAGFYFGIDRMASTDDYRLLANGRIVDKAAIIAAAVYVNEIEGEIEMDADGNIDTLETKRLEDAITLQVNNLMAGQISGFEAYINPVQDVINTSTVNIELRVQPLGYTSFINVTLGLTSSI